MPNIPALRTRYAKNTLIPVTVRAYALSAPAKSGVGCESPDNEKATQTPIASFFVSCQRIPAVSMVALVEQPKGWPVYLFAGTLTSASVTTPLKCESFGGDSLKTEKEIATMATTPPRPHPKYQYRFMALDRADHQAKPCRLSIESTSEHEARKALAPRYILSLAAVLPVTGGHHA